MKSNLKEIREALLVSVRSLILICCFFIVITIMLGSLFLFPNAISNNAKTLETAEIISLPNTDTAETSSKETGWRAPDESTIPNGEAGDQIRYGKELVAHTAAYLGPKGTVDVLINGMNCQNCHNDAGTKPFGINYSAVASTYPQFRPRANAMVSIVQRINGCFQRSMNGKALDPNSKEMKAMVAYIEWVGSEVPKGEKPENAGIKKLPYLDVAASPEKGEAVYAMHCQSCHGSEGEGILNAKGNEYIYPPLWGSDSYNDGAGLYRLRNFAGFVKYNMPFGATFNNPILSDEESWNVAAFVNSQPRPHKDQTADWADISKKPVDVPIGPYIDEFTEEQHKYGPFGPIEKAIKSKL